jgi:hypothetical protein
VILRLSLSNYRILLAAAFGMVSASCCGWSKTMGALLMSKSTFSAGTVSIEHFVEQLKSFNPRHYPAGLDPLIEMSLSLACHHVSPISQTVLYSGSIYEGASWP